MPNQVNSFDLTQIHATCSYQNHPAKPINVAALHGMIYMHLAPSKSTTNRGFQSLHEIQHSV